MNISIKHRSDPNHWIGERPVYPGHPVTCALLVLLAYPTVLAEAWAPYSKQDPWYACESYMNTPTAGGNLSMGCDLIRYVLEGVMNIDDAIAWGDRGWGGAGGHPQYVAPGQEQADRVKPRLRLALQGNLDAARDGSAKRVI